MALINGLIISLHLNKKSPLDKDRDVMRRTRMGIEVIGRLQYSPAMMHRDGSMGEGS